MVTKAIRPAIFKWRQTEPELILCAVRWYLRYSLSFRDVEELLSERGLEVDHTTIWRWVQRYGPGTALAANRMDLLDLVSAKAEPEYLSVAVPPELAGYEIETSSAADFDLLLEDA